MNNLDKQIRKLLREAVITLQTGDGKSETYDVDDKHPDVMDAMEKIKNSGQLVYSRQVPGVPDTQGPEIDVGVAKKKSKHIWTDPTEGKTGLNAALEALLVKADIDERVAYTYLKQKQASGVEFRIPAPDPDTIAEYMNAKFSDSVSLNLPGRGVGTKKVGRGEPVLSVAFETELSPAVEPDFVSKTGVKFSVKSFDNQDGARTSGGSDTAMVKDFNNYLLDSLNAREVLKDAKGKEQGSVTPDSLLAKLSELYTRDPKKVPKNIDEIISNLIEKEKNVLIETAKAHESKGIMCVDFTGGKPWSFVPAENAGERFVIFRIDVGSNRVMFHFRGKKKDFIKMAQELKVKIDSGDFRKANTLESKIRDTIKEMLQR